MKKHIYVFIVMACGCSLPVLGKGEKDAYFHPVFQKKFARAQTSSKVNSFKVGRFEQRERLKKLVFINWERLHWGSLGDLVLPKETWTENSDDGVDLQEMTEELRSELKSFEKRFNLKIIWRKPERFKNCPDVTNEFIEYWAQGLSARKNQGSITLASLRSSHSNIRIEKGRAQ